MKTFDFYNISTQVTKSDDNFISGREDYVGYCERRRKAMGKNSVTGLKILGFVGMALGFGSTILSNIVSEKNMKLEVTKQVAEALKDQK